MHGEEGMEIEYRPGWQDPSSMQPTVMPTVSSSSLISQRRRSSAANVKPAVPPPNLPIPSLPENPRRPAPSTMPDDLSDPPPNSYLTPLSLRSPERPSEPHNDRSLLVPQTDHPHRSEHRPSSRRALTRALELAREAVQLDSTNHNPEAAVNAYAQSVALLSEVMERVRNGEDSTTDSHRRRRRRSVAAQEEEVRRLQNIHDTYADRMNILSIIYSIPAVPYPTTSLYSNVGMSMDSTTSNSPTASASPSANNSPNMSQQAQTLYTAEDVSFNPNTRYNDIMDVNGDAVYALDESVLIGSSISGLPSTQHPYSLQYDLSPPPQPAPRASTISSRRPRALSNLPPKPPPPVSSLPPAPILIDPPVDSHNAINREVGDTHRHRKSPSGLGALEEETDYTNNVPPLQDLPDNQKYVPESSRILKHDSPPLPPLPSSTVASDVPGTPRSLSFSKPPPSPRLANAVASRPRALSQLPLRTEPNSTQYSNQSIIQRKKNSAPPSTRSASPAESNTSAGSVPPSMPALPISGNRSRSSSQPGRRPSIVGGRISPDQRPPLPGAMANGTPRKTSIPSKLNPSQSGLYVDTLQPQGSSFGAYSTLGFPANLPTTPTSALPPVPPNDPLLKPYHMMTLLRNTMVVSTGGYVTRRLHVPCEVWSQGGAKLTNLDDKIRVVTILCSALDDLAISSAEYFGAGNVSSGLALGIGSIGRKEADAWLSKLEEFSNVCDDVVSNFGKKLGVGEGFVSRKPTWGGKLISRIDKFTNGKNLDSPTAYVQGLKKLFDVAQLLDEHTKAVLAQPIAPAYAAFPVDIRGSTEHKLKRFSEFFASVVLTFVIGDLSQLLDKYVKKCEKWLAE